MKPHIDTHLDLPVGEPACLTVTCYGAEFPEVIRHYKALGYQFAAMDVDGARYSIEFFRPLRMRHNQTDTY